MPLRIEREDLWKRLATRFKARVSGEEDEGYPVLLDTLQPVTDFDELAKTQKIVLSTVSIDAQSAFTFFTVPQGKRHRLKVMRAARVAGDYQFSQFLLGDGSVSLPIFLCSASNDETTLFEGQEVIIPEGWEISIYFPAGTVTGNYTARILIDEMDAF